MRGDLNLDTVELKVLLNGKFGDANFRNAYVIVILNAQEKKSNAEAPTAALSVQTVAAPIVPVPFKGNGTESDPYIILAEPSTWVQLTATPSVKEGSLQTATAKWTVVGNASLNRAGNVIQAQAPATAYDETDKTPVTKLVYSIDNYNPTVDGNKTVTGKVYVEIRATGEAVNPSDTYDLTLGGVLAGSGAVTVFANGTLINGTNNVYTIPENANVVIYPAADEVVSTNLDGKTYEFAGVPVTFNDGGADGADTLTFTMSKSFALALTANDTAPGTVVTEVVSIKAYGGITATWTKDGEETQYLTADKTELSVPLNGKLVITGLGGGQAVAGAPKLAGSKAVATAALSDSDAMVANVAGLNGEVTSVNKSLTLYPVTKVHFEGTGVTGSGKAPDGTTTVSVGTSTDSGASWVANGTTLAISGGTFDGHVVTTDSSAVKGTKSTSLPVAGESEFYVFGANELNLGTGVTATVTSGGAALADGDLVKAGESVTLAADSDHVVVASKANPIFGSAVSAGAITKGEVYEAYTKVTLNVEASAKIETGTTNNIGQSATLTVASQTDATAVTVGVKSTTPVLVTAGANAAKTIVATPAAVAGVSTAGTTGSKATLEATIGDEAVTFTLSA